MDYQILSEESAFSGFFKINRYRLRYELFQGGWSEVLERECSRKGASVACLVHDPVKKVFIFVEQFRIGKALNDAPAWPLEIVAGIMDKPTESPEKCIAREAEEEIGTPVQNLKHLMTFYNSVGGSAGRTHLYLGEVRAEDCAEFTGLAEEGEDIKVVQLSYEETFKRFAEGEFDNTNTIIALQAFLLQQYGFTGEKI